MRYAVISDLHANIQAWNAAFVDIRAQEVDKIICLGDMVGYGPNPAEVLELLYSNVDHFVLGNHDAALAGLLDISYFSDESAQIIEWTRNQLGDPAIEFLRTIPLSLAGSGFRCTHGDFSNPGMYKYIEDPESALLSWQATQEPVLFVGHTHRPAIFVLGASGQPHMLEPEDFYIEEGEKRYIVNVGSLGQPRDGDARASYCTFDTDIGAIWWHRIPFDIDAYILALDRAGIPSEPSYFLTADPRSGVAPLRSIVNFSPPDSARKGVKGAVKLESLQELKKNVRNLRTTVMIMVALLSLAATLIIGLWIHSRTTTHSAPDMGGHELEVVGRDMSTILAADFDSNENLLRVLDEAVQPGQPISGWCVLLDNENAQSAGVAVIAPDTAAIILSSSTDNESIMVSSPKILVRAREKYQLDATFRKSDDFEGTVAVVISIEKVQARQRELMDQFIVKEPSMKAADGWTRAKKTFSTPVGATSMRYHIRGQFKGTCEIKNLELIVKK